MTHKLDAHDDGLDSRAREVLREIILQHIASGEAISSRSLARGGHFQLSPASLRNVMADLEDAGYLHQPHTSAGRVPTDRGYRFFIDHLMNTHLLTDAERHSIDDQVQSVSQIEDVLQLTSKLLSKLSDQVGIVFMPTLLQFTIRSIDFVLVAETKILCVVVGTNGMVVNKVIETRLTFTREELSNIGRYLTTEFSGMTLDAIRRRLIRLTEEERALHDQLLQKTGALEAQQRRSEQRPIEAVAAALEGRKPQGRTPTGPALAGALDQRAALDSKIVELAGARRV